MQGRWGRRLHTGRLANDGHDEIVGLQKPCRDALGVLDRNRVDQLVAGFDVVRPKPSCINPRSWDAIFELVSKRKA